jgi:hypothetical protein
MYILWFIETVLRSCFATLAGLFVFLMACYALGKILGALRRGVFPSESEINARRAAREGAARKLVLASEQRQANADYFRRRHAMLAKEVRRYEALSVEERRVEDMRAELAGRACGTVAWPAKRDEFADMWRTANTYLSPRRSESPPEFCLDGFFDSAQQWVDAKTTAWRNAR